MRLSRRTQGRIPIRLASTKWEFTVEDCPPWSGDSLSGLHQYLIESKPWPEARVQIVRNDRLIYDGPWQGLVADPTLW